MCDFPGSLVITVQVNLPITLSVVLVGQLYSFLHT